MLNESWYKMKSGAHKVVNFKSETFFAKKKLGFVFKMGLFTYLQVLEVFFFKKFLFLWIHWVFVAARRLSLVVMRRVTV